MRVFFFVFILVSSAQCFSQNQVPDEQWFASYKKAVRLSGEEACQEFKSLYQQASSKNFIKDLAWVYQQKHCEEKDLGQLLELRSNEWVSSFVSDVAFEIAVQQGNHKVVTDLSISLAQSKKSQNDQENILKQGIKSAASLGNDSLRSEIEKELWRKSPRLKPNPEKSIWHDVAEDHKTNREWQQAADMFRRIFDAAADSEWKTKIEALDGVRRSLKEKFRSDEAELEVFLRSSDEFGQYAFEVFKNKRKTMSLSDQRYVLLSWFQHGRDYWGYANNEREQKEKVRQVVNEALAFEDLPLSLQAEAYVLLSRVSKNYLEYENGAQEAKKAVDLLSRTRRTLKWQKELYDSALWFHAFLLRLDDKLDDSLKAMEKVSSQSNATWAQRRGQFWVARTIQQLEGDTKAQSKYQRFIDRYPFHYYSIWARYAANISVSPLARKTYSNPQRPKEVSQKSHQLILQLVAAGEARMARNYLNRFIRSTSTKFEHMVYRHFVGDHYSVMSAFYSMSAERKMWLQKNHSGLIYPLPHNPLVQSAAEKFDHVDEFYIYSIMRQESTFDPYSLSWADARGLLQLVPRIAEQEKQRAGVEFSHVDELFLPEVNIPIGSAALDTRFQINYNNFIIATGSYNAGEERVHRWWDKLFQGDVLEFLEDIPTEETRLYIRLVARNYFNYQRLAASGPIMVNPRFFELSSKPADLSFWRTQAFPAKPMAQSLLEVEGF